MAAGLRERLVGAWRLVDAVEEAIDGSPVRRPHGERPIGLILYTPDGYLSAQIMDRRRARSTRRTGRTSRLRSTRRRRAATSPTRARSRWTRPPGP